MAFQDVTDLNDSLIPEVLRTRKFGNTIKSRVCVHSNVLPILLEVQSFEASIHSGVNISDTLQGAFSVPIEVYINSSLIQTSIVIQDLISNPRINRTVNSPSIIAYAVQNVNTVSIGATVQQITPQNINASISTPATANHNANKAQPSISSQVTKTP